MTSEDLGLIILGSQQEKHGLLPLDTDTLLASYVALKAAFLTGAKLVGIVNSATEYPYLHHGRHHTVEAALKDLEWVIKNSIERLGIRAFLIINGHGGNKLIKDSLPRLEKEHGVTIGFYNEIVKLEGPHAASNECSMAVAAGFSEEEKLIRQDDFKKYPEVGFVGLKEALEADPKLRSMAQETLIKGIKIDPIKGEELLELAVKRAVKKIQEIKEE